MTENTIMNFFIRLNNYLIKTSRINFILIMLIFTYLILIPFLGINCLIPNASSSMGHNSIVDEAFLTQLLAVVLLAPIYETFMFQWFPIYVLNSIVFLRNNKYKDLLIIIISAALFSATHYYSMLYIVMAFLVGIILAYSFIICEKKRSESAFITVAIIHSLRNLITFILLHL